MLTAGSGHDTKMEMKGMSVLIVLELRINISCAMQDANQRNAILNGLIKHHITTNRKLRKPRANSSRVRPIMG